MRKPSQPALCLPIELWSNLSNSVNKPLRSFGIQSFLLSCNVLFLRYFSEQHKVLLWYSVAELKSKQNDRAKDGYVPR